MALLLICPSKDPAPWIEAFRAHVPSLEVRVWPDVGDPGDVRYAILWDHPPLDWNTFTRLKAISSLGAGIDHLINDPLIPGDLPIARIVDPDLVQSMSEYVVTAVLTHFREFGAYLNKQREQRWQPEMPRRIREFQVGIMGMGQLGMDAARMLKAVGFSVTGWSRKRSESRDLVRAYAGNSELKPFLSTTNILVCLLPLTSKTRGILNRKLLTQLPRDSYIVNAARGGHLVEEDLLNLINTGHLSGACLDVFENEPLPASHSFWTIPEIRITPHIASITNPHSAVAQIFENYTRAINDQPLLHQVDLKREY